MTTPLAYDVAGDGSAVVLLHSSVANRHMWQPQWADLTARFRVVSCDLAGFGESPLPSSGWCDAEDVLAVMDRLGIETAAVVGASYGGRVALELATTAPQRVSRLVLLCPAYSGVPSTEDADAFDREEVALLEAGDVDAAVALNVRTWLGPETTVETRQQVAQWQRETFALQADAPDDLAPTRVTVDPSTIDAPALVVSGGHDLPYFRLVAAHLAAALRHARYLDLPWAGHLPSLERPEVVTELLLAELGGGEPGEPGEPRAAGQPTS
jgi:pimeloyl-ACP methyl ester carboxylesterase